MSTIFFSHEPVQANQQGKKFSDLPHTHLFYDEIMYLASKNIISGFPDGQFKANNTVTRAQAAIIIAKSLGLKGGKKNPPFRDVNGKVTGAGYISAAVEKGIIRGFPDQTFRPYEPVTRAQMAILINRAYKLSTGGGSSFKDIHPQMASYQAIVNAASNQIANGYTDGTYRPDQVINRGQFSAFVARAMDPSFRGKKVKESLADVLYHAILNVETEINIGGFTKNSDEAFRTLRQVFDDHPEIFYLNYRDTTFWPSSGRIKFSYHYSKSQIMTMKQKLNATVDKILRENIRSNMSEYAKVKAIHDYVVATTAYDYDNYRYNTVPYLSYTMYGALVNRTAVCDGYAKSMLYLLRKAGVETLYVPGTVNGHSHAWNKVKIDGQWYNVDATFDDPVPDKPGDIEYDFFLLSDQVLARSHVWEQAQFPTAVQNYQH